MSTHPAIVTSPAGRKFDTTTQGTNVTLRHTDATIGTTVVVVQGGSTTTSALLAGIGDAIGDALLALVKVMTCQMQTTTTVEVGSDGKISKVITTTTCVH
jgi:hypothetical protein